MAESAAAEQLNSPAQSAVSWGSFSLRQAELLRTVGMGTFGRVIAIREKASGEYFALKILVIEDVMRLKLVDQVKNEKAILKLVNHPFLVRLHWTSHDLKFLYMVQEFVSGGQLYTYLQAAGKFCDSVALFYAAEILSAIAYLHDAVSVVYRDLKPENLLLDWQGHVKVTDFGCAKVLTKDRTFTMCGTPEYLAPEVILGRGYNWSADFWSLGVLIYEMLAGSPPFYDADPMQVYEKVLAGEFHFPAGCDADESARDLVRRLLVRDRVKRLGGRKSAEVLGHAWFRGLDWADVTARRLQPPIAPRVQQPPQAGAPAEDDWKKVPSSSAMAQKFFRDF